MLPSGFTELRRKPALYKFVKEHLDMQFDDVRGMMKLPLHGVGITGGCNFAAAAIICNLISGISMELYTPRKRKSGSGKRFKELLERFYPWEEGENKVQNSEVIYDMIRNPLSHSLGVLRKDSLPISIDKHALTETQLQQIENSGLRPHWVPLAVTGDTRKYILSVPGLYWGTFHMLQNLAKDRTQLELADRRMSGRELAGGPACGGIS
jgi:hypothetical protein